VSNWSLLRPDGKALALLMLPWWRSWYVVSDYLLRFPRLACPIHLLGPRLARYLVSVVQSWSSSLRSRPSPLQHFHSCEIYVWTGQPSDSMCHTLRHLQYGTVHSNFLCPLWTSRTLRGSLPIILIACSPLHTPVCWPRSNCFTHSTEAPYACLYYLGST